MPPNPYFIVILEKYVFLSLEFRLEMFFQLIEGIISLFSVYVCCYQSKESFFFLQLLLRFFCVFGFLLFCYDVFRCVFLIDYVIDWEFQGCSGRVLGVGEG